MMFHNLRSIGFAFLLSLILVSGVSVAANLLLSADVAQSACYQSYSLACVI